MSAVLKFPSPLPHAPASEPVADQAPSERVPADLAAPFKANRLAFTTGRLVALARAGKAGFFHDTRTPGLSVLVGKTKSVYVHTLRLPGQRSATRIRLGTVGVLALDDARAAVAATAGARAKGEAVLPPRQARKAAREARQRAQEASRRDELTLQEAFEMFLAGRDLKLGTIRTYRDVWRHLPKALRAAPLGRIDAGVITSLHAEVGRRAGKRTSNKLVALMSCILRTNGRKADNPAADVKRFREAPRSRRLSVEEGERLRAVLKVWRTSEDQARALAGVFITIALMTGARRQSVEAMRWIDLDLRAGQGTWHIPAAWSKNGTELALPLTDEAATVLMEWQSRSRAVTSPWVFPSTSASGHIEDPRKTWNRIRAEAGTADVTLHDLRRSLGSEVAAAGGSAAVIAASLGHLSLQSARSYLHLNVSETRNVLERIRRADAGRGEASPAHGEGDGDG